MIIVLDSPEVAVHLAVAIRAHLATHTAQLARNGAEPPRELVSELTTLADTLMPQPVTVERHGDVAAARRRALGAARTARYRARRKCDALDQIAG